ncbi:hypothetical protein AU255_00690 [Methyloprofundus sedimenti]|uniref:SCP2 domain-containing protein n=1 Tax=Methyloprofundus sedimenti TaxID=1420851 RepID=A0A1V8M4L1_9GAMM|nr:sulfotransferase [Methyloprofundus sedimenti]OQK16458.1 hypothetical protein AU255_00690 [Methyloprofundus sedimenti]
MTSLRADKAKVQPIFILSCERSGSTLLRLIVDTHSEIACPGQLYLGSMSNELYRTMNYSLGQTFDATKEIERKELVLQEVRGIIDGLMERYSAARNKSIWCEKTTLNTDYLKILSDLFPEARYICLYRNCMDVVHSCLKFNPLGFMPELVQFVQRYPENLVVAMAENWLAKNEKIFTFETTHPDQCFRVHYEHMVNDPLTVLPPLFEFLGVDWEECILQKVFSVQHDQGEGDLKVHFSRRISGDSIGKGKSIPLATIPGGLKERLDKVNDWLDYPSLESFYQDNCKDILSIESHSEKYSHAKQIEPDEFFKIKVREIIREKGGKVDMLRGMCRFVVDGKGGGSWVIDLSESVAEIREARDEDQADCTIAITYGAFLNLINDTASVEEVYERGEVTSFGSEPIALQFGKLLFG